MWFPRVWTTSVKSVNTSVPVYYTPDSHLCGCFSQCYHHLSSLWTHADDVQSCGIVFCVKELPNVITVACRYGHDWHSEEVNNVPWRGEQYRISLHTWFSCWGDGSEAQSQLRQIFGSHALWSTETADSSFDKCPSITHFSGLKTHICSVHLPSILVTSAKRDLGARHCVR